MNKILKTMNYANLAFCVCEQENIRIIVYQEGICSVSTWSKDGDNFKKNQLKIEELSEWQEQIVLEKLKLEIKRNINSKLEFELFKEKKYAITKEPK